MNLPNKLTLARVILAPAFMVFMVLDFGDTIKWNYLVALVLFCAASITDFADGHIARKYNLITNFGKFLDPLADKFLVIGALCCLCLLEENRLYGKVLLLATVVVVLRELAVSGVRLVVAKEGVVVPANIFGKIKTVSQMGFIISAILVLMLANYNLPPILLTGLTVIRMAFLVVMTVMTVVSGVIYLNSYRKYIDPSN